MIDPKDPLDVQVAKQAKIIDALVRRAGRQHEVGHSAYSAFQSAIALQGQIWAKTRDLERASNELELVRYDREQTQKNLSDALSVMEGGFALFTDGELQVCNDLFKTLLPDISHAILPGLGIEAYFDNMEKSALTITRDVRAHDNFEAARRGPTGVPLHTFVVELQNDRWFQISQQRTSSDNVIILQTEITDIVRKNKSERDSLIDMQAHYLQAAFDHMSLGICTFSRDGMVMIHNDRFRELLGLSYILLHKRSSFSRIWKFIKDNYLVSAPDLGGMDNWLVKLKNDGMLRERLRHANGKVLDLHVHRLPDGGFLVDVKDVTLESRTTQLLEKRVEERTSELTEANRRLTRQYEEKARVEEELRLAKEQAEAAVSSKTRFLAAASHDLLQPINAAKLLISTLGDMARGSQLEHMVERLDGSFQSMESLLHALLDISRLESTGSGLTPSEFCLGTMMRTIIEDQSPFAARKGVQLDVVPTSVWVRSDQRYLLRSIQNLVVNAIQYTENGRVLVGCRRRSDSVVFEVWDTGIGISNKDQKRIFDEFTRAENVPAGTGMGLGLSIVDRTCRHLGHVLGVRSKPGVGSVFSIEIETVLAQPPVTTPALPLGEIPESELDLIVLVIENEPDVLFATVQKLESWGASALGTRSTSEALTAVRDLGMPPDIILADYQLDGTDTGIHSIRAIRQETQTHIPAIMITADRRGSLVQAGVEEDFTVLTKPVQLSRLRPLIDWKIRVPSATDKSIA